MAKTALVTGATSGIGEATARILAKKGYNVVITGRRVERLGKISDELEEEYGIKCHALMFDIRDRTHTESMIKALPEHLRHIDLLVNNAGLASGFEHIDEGDSLDWDQMIDTNVKGLLYITRPVVRQMIRRGEGGHIINVGSTAGTQVYENGAVYCASKHAVHAISKGMRIDLLAHGIKVTEIRPGMVKTEFSVVRFHGDYEKAKKVYTGVEPLSGEDIADIIGWIVDLPPHVNINEIEVTPTQQADATTVFRK